MKISLQKTALTALAPVLLSSCASMYNNKANNEYDQWQYANAAKHYELALNKKSFDGSREKMAYSYYKINNINEAEKNYRKVIGERKLSALGYLHFANVLVEQQRYDEAASLAKAYLVVFPSDVTAQMILASCNSVYRKYFDTTLYTLNKLDIPKLENIYGTTPYNKGIIVAADVPAFNGKPVSSWTGNSYLDLYYLEKDTSGKWINPVMLKGGLEGRFHEGPATFKADGKTAYFTRSNYLNARKLDKNTEKISNLKIYSSQLVNGVWNKPVELSFNSNEYSCGHPALNAEGNVLYFISDMPGGFGGTDIYRSVFKDNNWSAPQNLGNVVNSPGNEMFPFMSNDGTLYFSSTGHNSLGGLDVFMTTEINGKWARPENLNYPLNSSADDFSYVLSPGANTGFVTSSRANGNDNLYAFKKNPPTFILYGKARKKGTQIQVEGVKVEITDAATKEVITKASDRNGKFEMNLEPEKEYLLYCTKLGCFTRTGSISTRGLKYSQNFYADFEVEEIVIDKPIVLENIFYDFDKWEIRADAAAELNKLVKVLNDNPTISIELSSHTDCRGSDQYNMVLSDKRAHAAVDYIIARGIDATRLRAKGYGERKPINKCIDNVVCTEEEYQLNRRTEFKVIKINPQLIPN